VGGVSGRAGAKAGGSNLSANDSFACRGGRRHPGFPEGGALRGASSERRPRSVRLQLRVSSRGPRRADDRGCLKDAEEGNAVGMRKPSACTRRRHERSSHAPGDASFARSFDPCTSILTMLLGASLGGGAAERASRLGKLAQARGTSTGAFIVGRSAARRVSPLPQGRERGTSEEEGDRGLRPCENRGARVWLPARRSAVAEVDRRRLVSNKLGKRAPKRAVRVE
jgi:hypothetical protein